MPPKQKQPRRKLRRLKPVVPAPGHLDIVVGVIERLAAALDVFYDRRLELAAKIKSAGDAIATLKSRQQESRVWLDVKGYAGVKFRGAQRDCVPCELRRQCLRKPDTSQTRQVVFFSGKDLNAAESATERMKRRIDSAAGRARYAQRLAIVEPVFANLRHNKRLDRFTLRGRRKVDNQWKLYCLVHNIEKLAKHRTWH
jgi:hypothetical protein